MYNKLVPERGDLINKKILSLAIVLTITFIGYTAFDRIISYFGISLNTSSSMPVGLYYKNYNQFPEKRGDIVQTCPNSIAVEYMKKWHPELLSSGICSPHYEPFLKIAIALPGDHVSVRADGIHINGGIALPGSKPLVKALGPNLSYHSLPQLSQKEWVIQKNQVWAYTPEWFSFDSRYFGPVYVKSLMYPLLVHKTTPNTIIPPEISAQQN